MRSIKVRRGLVAAALLVAMVVSACSGATDKSGGADTTTLTLASNDGTNLDGAPAVARFVDRVAELSGGRLEVEVVGKWFTEGEQDVLAAVVDGEADLAWSGTRAMDTIGVDTFRPLHAPFLVGSYAAQRAVVGDDRLAGEMLAGLDGSGLTGLALLADELRFPAAAEGPIRGADDLDGLAFGIMPSNSQAAGMKVLGARVKAMSAPHPPGTDGLFALETSWHTYLANNQQSLMPFVTANAVLWPRTTVILANDDTLAALDEEDRDVLDRAAADAATWSLQHADDRVVDEIDGACEAGARIVTATPGELDALRLAAEPAYAALRSDPAQASVLSDVESLAAAAEEPEELVVPDGCAYRPGDEDALAAPVLPDLLDGPGDPGELPAGTYRYELGLEEIRDGVGDVVTDSRTFATANAGVWTWTLADGRWDYEIKLAAQEVPAGYAGLTCEGYYDVHGAEVHFTTVTVYASGDCASETWKAEWRQTDGGLVLDVQTGAEDLDFLFGAKTWERID